MDHVTLIRKSYLAIVVVVVVGDHASCTIVPSYLRSLEPLIPCNSLRTAAMTRSARNCVLVPVDFGAQ